MFSGVGKTAAEVEYALESGIHSFNCESEAELALIDAMAARLGKKAGFSIRVNPDVDAVTHPYISTGLSQHKFGIAIACAAARLRTRAAIPQPGGRRRELPHRLADSGPQPDSRSRGQGAGARQRNCAHRDTPSAISISAADSAWPITRGEESPGDRRIRGDACPAACWPAASRVMVEPGRSIVGPAGVLLTRVLYRKRNGDKEFLIVDAAMNDLIRPSLYRAHHEILPLRKNALPAVTVDVVGPVCETGDFLARDRSMANAMPGDFLAISTAGAYGFVQSSNYNSRPRAPEVLVEGATWRIIRQRENYQDLVRGETL